MQENAMSDAAIFDDAHRRNIDGPNTTRTAAIW
jgi:hypothetical protein